MDANGDIALREAISGALDWWRDAGVDWDYGDAPMALLDQETTAPAAPDSNDALPAQPSKKPAPAAPSRQSAPKTPRLDPAQFPSQLAGFHQWWLAEASLAEGAPALRVSPRGEAGAKLMVVVPEPEREDRDTLLSGPQGKLLQAMLRAMGLGDEDVYLATALPRHLPGANWQQLAEAGMGALLSHHVHLAAPKRLAIFGTSVLSLIGNDLPQGPAVLQDFNHEGVKLPMLAARSLEALLEQPRWKAGIWQAWLDWNG